MDWFLYTYFTYLQMLILLMMAVTMTIPAVMVIMVILKNSPLRTRSNVFLVNLLVADVCAVLF